MALPKLSPPPWNQPFNLPNGNANPGWTQFFDLVYRWMGSGTGEWQGDVAGNAATASTSNGVQVVMNAGNPEGMQQASPGVFYIDTDTSTVYVKSANDDATGWQVL